MSIDGTQTRRMYCSNACKQRHYETSKERKPLTAVKGKAGEPTLADPEALDQRILDLKLRLEEHQGSYEDLRDYIRAGSAIN
jgi:hypothetical protein